MVDKGDFVHPELLEGIERLDDFGTNRLACDPLFVIFGVHSTSLDDAEADVDDVGIMHRVAGTAGVARASEEVMDEGLGMDHRDLLISTLVLDSFDRDDNMEFVSVLSETSTTIKENIKITCENFVFREIV